MVDDYLSFIEREGEDEIFPEVTIARGKYHHKGECFA